MNIKPLAEAQDIQAAASTGTLTSGTLAWVVNAHTAANRVTTVSYTHLTLPTICSV